MATDQATVIKQAQAAAWALNQVGAQNYYNLCQRFIENAYGTSGQYRTASAAGNALNMQTDPYDADVGDLVFFRPDASNGGAGHVGINIGNGQMVSATNKGVTVDNFLTNPYWKGLFVGIGDPPPQWQGRPDSKELISGAATMVGQAKAAAGDVASQAWGAAAPYAAQLMQAAATHDVPVNVLAGLLIQESGGDPRAVSRAGAQGLMQFMPGTAKGMGIDPFDPAQAIDAGARYLKQLADRAGGDWSRAVGMYNAGPAGNLNNAETRNHITKVMGFAEQIGGGMQLPPPGGPFGGPPPPGGPGGDRNRDRNRPGQQGGSGVSVPPQVQTGIGYLLDYINRLTGQAGDLAGQIPRPDISVSSGQRQGGGNQQVVPGMPGMEGITSGRGQPGAVDGTVQVSISDIKDFLAQGNSAGLADFLRAALNSALPGAQMGTSVLPYGAGAPGGPGGGGRRDDAFTRGIAGQEQRDQGGPGPTAGPSQPGTGAAATRPPGWTDPNRYQGTNRSIVEQANALAEQIAAAQAVMSRASPDSIEYFQAKDQLTTAQARLVQLAPQLAAIEKEAQSQQEGTVLPGSAYAKTVKVLRKNPDTGQPELVEIPIQNPEENPAIETANIAAGASRYGADISRQNALTQAQSSRYATDVGSATSLGVAGIGAQSAANVANINSATQRTTAALSAAVEQQKSRIDAMIRTGQISAEDGHKRWEEWYKVNVAAPLAILEQQRQNELYKIQQHQAITQRAGQQAEHERGMAQIGANMWGNATTAYMNALDRSAPVGWNEALNQNLAGMQSGGNGQWTPMPTQMQVPNMEDWARNQVAWILKDVSPYAASIANAQGQIGDPGQAMSGNQMTALGNQATGVASNALANPMVTQPYQPPALPPPINPSDYVSSPQGGMPQLQLPQYSSSGSGYGRG